MVDLDNDGRGLGGEAIVVGLLEPAALEALLRNDEDTEGVGTG